MSDRPDDYAAFRAEVLFDAEQDWHGIYEVWWAANARYPTLPLSQRLAIAEELVSDLLSSREVAVYRADEWPPSRFLPVPVDEVPDLLLAWTTWVVQEPPSYWLSSDIPAR